MENLKRRLFAYPDFLWSYLFFLLIGSVIVTAVGASLYCADVLIKAGPSWWTIVIMIVSALVLTATFIGYCFYSKHRDRKLLPNLDQMLYNAQPKVRKMTIQMHYGDKYNVIAATEE